MPQTFPTNYTITSVTYNNVTAGSNVSAAHPTAVLVLTPDPGYTLDYTDFSIEGGLPMGTSSIVFTQAGANVNCTVTFSTSLAMPSADLDISLCINGMGTLERFHVSGEIDPVAPNTNCTVDPAALYSFDVSGDYGDSVLVYDVLIEADSGYYFPVAPSLVQVNGENSLFTFETTNYNDVDGNLIGCMISVSCSIPSYDSIENNFIVRASAEEIYIKGVLITDYTVDTSIISEEGDFRILTLLGGEGADWELTCNLPIFLTAEIDPITNMNITTDILSGTMDGSGITEIKLVFPKNSVTTQYEIDLTGDLVSPFPSPLPILMDQLQEVTVGFQLTTSSRASVVHTLNESKTYSALGTTPIGVGVAESTNEWTISSTDGGTINLAHDPTIDDVDNWPIVSQRLDLGADNDTVLIFRDLTGIEVGMDIIDPLQQFNNTVLNVNTFSNEVTITYPITVPTETMINFSYNKGTYAAFGPFTVEQIDDYTIKLTEESLITRFGYADADFTFNAVLREEVTSYDIPDGDISALGETRTYYVYGDTNAVFSLTLYDGTTYTNLATNQVLTTTGEWSVAIVFPPLPGGVSKDWTLTLTGDLSPTFNTPSGQPSVLVLHQPL